MLAELQKARYVEKMYVSLLLKVGLYINKTDPFFYLFSFTYDDIIMILVCYC